MIEEIIRHLIENPDNLKDVTQGAINLIGVSADEADAIIKVLNGSINKAAAYWN
ncbi:hypothetical protein M670_01395 [Schinkia azotoformans MEV2011]|uniref:ComX pheromone n=1 Tax=Schinkia azotoformans MEV2011 TaxID=1348973 RepID=A0A072NRY1_SCHAZ|nr:competence pheromone ComX [Schinkia azotoformans]KEF39618.1 hypothetical protein M670_01395 [Schinkia azotoformans MEV2011]MEC1694306.1 competence pheromone ComX [Schinkia azotoformans]MEC1714892.1 competence pheromone ComX [Schinkia azotoformans]MEC1723480.1 competence pheromone ComX [Schinkia azotoformans]MEC1742830.1 competence pheromone ComX [Schinkia azotoformans]